MATAFINNIDQENSLKTIQQSRCYSEVNLFKYANWPIKSQVFMVNLDIII